MNNRIIIENNILEDIDNEVFLIKDKTITFKKSGNYVIEYVNSTSIELNLIVKDNLLVNLFISSIDNDIKINNHYYLGINSELIHFQFYYNKNVIENTTIDLDGEKSFYSGGFSSIARGSEEYHIIVNHNNEEVRSDIRNKCIGLDKSSITLDINSCLDRGNTNSIMDQTSRILTLGEVDARIVPNMFIDEASVNAKHGSVIGGFDKELLFYLNSRGISNEEAINLLMKGFIFSNLNIDMYERGKIFEIIQKINN